MRSKDEYVDKMMTYMFFIDILSGRAFINFDSALYGGYPYQKHLCYHFLMEFTNFKLSQIRCIRG